jgi:hypothetical protein
MKTVSGIFTIEENKIRGKTVLYGVKVLSSNFPGATRVNDQTSRSRLPAFYFSLPFELHFRNNDRDIPRFASW